MATSFTDWGAHYIEHHGIKGMRWGERRFQYDDGSLTPQGKVHYAKSGTISSGSKKSPKRQYSSDEMNRIKTATKKGGIIGGFAALHQVNKAQGKTTKPAAQTSSTASKVVNNPFAKQSKRAQKALKKSGAYALGAVLANNNGRIKQAERFAKKANKYMRKAQKRG